MKLDQRAWIPIIGIFFGYVEGIIVHNEEWRKYQLTCIVVWIILGIICW